jgi:hypothetical protein
MPMINHKASIALTITTAAVLALGVATPSFAKSTKSEVRAQATASVPAAPEQRSGQLARAQEQCWLSTDDHRGLGYMTNCDTPRAMRMGPHRMPQ